MLCAGLIGFRCYSKCDDAKTIGLYGFGAAAQGRRIFAFVRPGWGERRIESVANLTRADGERFMQVAADVPLKTAVRRYALEEANEALRDLRAGTLEGAAVLLP